MKCQNCLIVVRLQLLPSLKEANFGQLKIFWVQQKCLGHKPSSMLAKKKILFYYLSEQNKIATKKSNIS